MLTELAALALTCAPNIHPVTLDALIRHESSAQQYAIGVNRKSKALPRQPENLKAATQAAEDLMAQGIDFDAGLGQINVRNWAWLGLNSTTVFDPCQNLAAAQTVLADCYARALRNHQREQQALRAALSCYNTGNFSRGFANGYVDKVLAQAGIQVPALKPVPDDAASADDPQSSTADAPDSASAQIQSPPTGTPDGFTAHPIADGFQPPSD
ncbi:MAG: lytic transglycosylase domain-containing protein [Castellaniella sp.]|jgi:type IV secretion system protein VirB1|uniref:lytic transglycosylase domain-containing protein n=1 Tax=Castellaniella sp. TaxID=1955812 RepID=UPI00261B8DFD|nr:lytic transglycosylase domain-containing protein [uncultured Castellaniella sp.]